MAGYYCRLIWNFANISAELHACTQKNASFKWIPNIAEAFTTFKEQLYSAPVLAYPYFGRRFTVETYTSSKAVGAVLAQKRVDGYVHLIRFASRTMAAA